MAAHWHLKDACVRGHRIHRRLTLLLSTLPPPLQSAVSHPPPRSTSARTPARALPATRAAQGWAGQRHAGGQRSRDHPSLAGFSSSSSFASRRNTPLTARRNPSTSLRLHPISQTSNLLTYHGRLVLRAVHTRASRRDPDTPLRDVQHHPHRRRPGRPRLAQQPKLGRICLPRRPRPRPGPP